MNFEEVLTRIRAGHDVRFARRVWGQDKCIFGADPTTVTTEEAESPVMAALCEQYGGQVVVLGAICGCYRGQVQVNIALSSDDMLADDWEAVA